MTSRHWIISVAVALALIQAVASFQVGYEASQTYTQVPKRRGETMTKVGAWTLLSPPESFTFKSTWYTEVDHPGARTLVYDDMPNEFRFVTLGDDWPSVGGETNETPILQKSRVPINPIRRARKWISRRMGGSP